MKIILIRHGMTEGNLKRRYIGTTDEDLINTDCLKGDYPKCEDCRKSVKEVYSNGGIYISECGY
ncbi:MAG: hypothetical protein ACLS7B_04545 [Hominilimicola sp.]